MSVINSLIVEIVSLNPLQASFLKNSVDSLNDDDRRSFGTYIEYCLDGGYDLTFLAKSYDLIVKDTFREQVYFKRHKRYRYSSFSQVADSVYFSDEYMEKYMYGLAISAFLWPNHRAMHHFFLDELPRNISGCYLEIGPGHGFYFMQSMLRAAFSSYTGIDISPTSVAMTKDILESKRFGSFSGYNIIQSDFLAWEPSRRYEYIVMSEVLEHVENPCDFLLKIRDVLSPEGKVFITTCINAPAIDHIYLYENLGQLEDQVKNSGLRVSNELVVPYNSLSLDESMAQKLPVNVAMSLELQ